MRPDKSIRRIRPSDVPFSEGMTDEQAASIASIDAFRDLDSKYRSSKSFFKLLQLHARIVRYHSGDLIVREGDWGNSAFFIVSGEVVVECEPPGSGLPDEILGRRPPQRKTFLQSLAQLWQNHPEPEYRSQSSFVSDSRDIASRTESDGARVYLQDVPSVVQRYATTSLRAGQFFGELAALGRTARTATAFAKGEVEIVEIRWQGLRDLMRRDTGLRARFDRQFRELALAEFLQNAPLLAHLKHDEQAIAELVSEVELHTYGDYDRPGTFMELAAEDVAGNLESEPLIAEEGSYPSGVIIIRNGLARVSHRHHHGHRTVSYLTAGKMYGYEEIAESWQQPQPRPMRYSLRAIGFLTAVLVPTRLIEKYVLNRPDSAANQQRQQAGWWPWAKKRKPVRRATSQDIGQDLVEFLVQHRFVNGTATMLIDLDRCTRCDDCVRACASAHDNNPRFLRQGPIHENIMVANACMHCQDPVCMIECPTGAISRRLDQGEVTINTATCIGCANCANNCPYDAIRMVEIRRDDGSFIRDQVKREPITKATKCDLCVDQLGGPACQRACPHDALVRIDMSDYQAVDEWRRR